MKVKIDWYRVLGMAIVVGVSLGFWSLMAYIAWLFS